jgi:opacity protein-like surface antigen
MKKQFLKTFAIAALLTSTSFAETAVSTPSKANSFGGFYIGAHTGLTSTTVKRDADNSTLGKTNALFGLNAGYLSMINACTGLGIDLNIEYSKADLIKEFTATGTTKTTLSKKWAGHLAPVFAYRINPSTLLYVKLGMQYNPGLKVTQDTINAAGATTATVDYGKKSAWNPLVGVGGKMALHSNFFLTAEYTYAMPKEVKWSQNNKEQKAKISNHGLRLGLQYKF